MEGLYNTGIAFVTQLVKAIVAQSGRFIVTQLQRIIMAQLGRGIVTQLGSHCSTGDPL